MESGNSNQEPIMKLNDLKKAGAKAYRELQLAERKAEELQRKAMAAKALAEQARLKHKRARKAAKQAKHLALAAEEQVRDQLRAWEKAQKRLGKALKKAAKSKTGKAKRPALATSAPRQSHPGTWPETWRTVNSKANPRQPAPAGCVQRPTAQAVQPTRLSRPAPERRQHQRTNRTRGCPCRACNRGGTEELISPARHLIAVDS